jgi:hypothetical protein
VPPNATAEGLARLVPVMIIVTPPVGGPEVVLVLVIIGVDIVDQDNQVLNSKKKCRSVNANGITVPLLSWADPNISSRNHKEL